MDKKPFILIAEDEQAHARVYQLKFEQEGIDVKVVEDGDQALEVLRKENPSLLLLDLMMPGKSGFEVLEEIRKDPKLKDTKVVVLSNLGQSKDIVQAQKLGVLDYLVKSDYSIHDIVTKVKKHL
jgi:two-component system alkaline phosphatase synthesis response regulator PhoP